MQAQPSCARCQLRQRRAQSNSFCSEPYFFFFCGCCCYAYLHQNEWAILPIQAQPGGGGGQLRSQKQKNKALTLAHAQTIHYTSNILWRALKCMSSDITSGTIKPLWRRALSITSARVHFSPWTLLILLLLSVQAFKRIRSRVNPNPNLNPNPRVDPIQAQSSRCSRGRRQQRAQEAAQEGRCNLQVRIPPGLI